MHCNAKLYTSLFVATAYFAPIGQYAITAERIGDAWNDPQNPIVKIFKGQRLDLWSLRKPQRSALPPVKQQDWVRNPIDTFILAAKTKELQT